jgi:hypothetical protein
MNNTRKNKNNSKKNNSKDKCIIINFKEGEGLGNQLFIYAAGLTVKHKHNLPICIIKAKNNPHSKRNYRNLFNATKLNNSSSRNSLNIIGPRNISNGWNIPATYNDKKNIKLPDNLYQNYKSIKHVIPLMKTILLKNEFNKNPDYMKYKNLIESPLNTAFMHVRRGDKIQRGQVLDVKYFQHGLEHLNNDTNIKTIYIFSNDMHWCKEENDANWKMVTKTPIIYYDNSDELIILYMMMNCLGGAILSDSTFGIWGAILGPDTNPNSKILYNSKPLDFIGTVNPMQFPDRWIGL